MTTEACSADNFSKSGTFACTGCAVPKARYCSQPCQKSHWTFHKKTCAGAEKYNRFIIRAVAPNDGAADADHLEPFSLRKFGEWTDEMNELDDRLGWVTDFNASKFYSHQNVDNWYYYVYQDTREGLPPNPIASRCAGRPVLGDVAVVRSAPEGQHGYDSLFSKTELLKTLTFYKSRTQ